MRQAEILDLRTLWNETNTRNETQAGVAAAFLLFNNIVLSATLLLGLPGNLLVCCVLRRTRSLRTPNAALLLSLAAGDLLSCTLDAPLLLFSLLRDGSSGGVSRCACALQQFSYALCSCVQLLTLVAVSVERFQAIAFPFRAERRRSRVRLWILCVWACSLVLAAGSLVLPGQAPFYMPCRVARNRESPGAHSDGADPFGACVLVSVWGCSLAVIVVHYVRIFRIVRQHGQKVLDSGIQLKPTAARHVWDQLGVGGSGPLPGDPCRTLLHVLPGAPAAPGSTEAGPSCRRSSSSGGAPPEILGAVCLLTPCVRERGKKRMEGKLAQRFGYIITVFILFWVPMVVTLVMNITSWRETDSFLIELGTSATVLTCVPAAVDPLIYTMVTRQFRSEFSKILSSIPGCPLLWRR